MHLDNWRFLHGVPAFCCGSWVLSPETSLCGEEACINFSTVAAELSTSTASEWHRRVCDKDNLSECVQLYTLRDAMSLQRAQHFAATTNTQVLWVQSEDYMNDVHVAEMSQDEIF